MEIGPLLITFLRQSSSDMCVCMCVSEHLEKKNNNKKAINNTFEMDGKLKICSVNLFVHQKSLNMDLLFNLSLQTKVGHAGK